MWRARNDSVYTVEHYCITGDGTLKEVITSSFTGITDDPATAVALGAGTNSAFVGYAYSAGYSAVIGGQTLSEILSGTVLADGSLVLKLYYEPTAQTITVNTGAGHLERLRELLQRHLERWQDRGCRQHGAHRDDAHRPEPQLREPRRLHARRLDDDPHLRHRERPDYRR